MKEITGDLWEHLGAAVVAVTTCSEKPVAEPGEFGYLSTALSLPG